VGTSADAAQATGTGGAAGDAGAGTGPLPHEATTENMAAFRSMSKGEQESYISKLSQTQYDNLYGSLTPTQKEWFDAQDLEINPSGSGTGSGGAGDANTGDDGEYTPDAYIDSNQQGAQDLYIKLMGTAEGNADDLAYWQTYIDEHGFEAAETAMRNSAEYAAVYNSTTQGEDWLLDDPHGYLTGMVNYDPSGIADESTQGELKNKFTEQAGPEEAGLRTGDGERFVADPNAVADLDAGEATQAVFREAHANWFMVLEEASQKAMSNMAGTLAADVRRQITVSAAEGSMQRGFGLSPAAVNYAARDLGLTSLDLQNMGIQQANAIAASYETKRGNDLNFLLKNADLAESGRQFNAQFEFGKEEYKLAAAKFNETIREFNETILEGQYEFNRGTRVDLITLAETSREFNQTLLQVQEQFGTTVALDTARAVTQIAQYNSTFLQVQSQFDDQIDLDWSQYQTDIAQSNSALTLAYDTLNEQAWDNRADYVTTMSGILATTMSSYMSAASSLAAAGGDTSDLAATFSSLFDILAQQGSDYDDSFTPISSSMG